MSSTPTAITGIESPWLSIPVIAVGVLLMALFVLVALRLRRLRQLATIRRS
jgi:hypothetical protein